MARARVHFGRLNGGNLDAPNPLQTEICRSERSQELAEFSNIQDLQQKKVSPGDINTYNVMQPSREEKHLEKSAMDPYIFNSMTSSATDSLTVLRNSLTWWTKDIDMPFIGKNSNGKLQLNGHSQFLNEKGIYKNLISLPYPDPSMPTEEGLHNLKSGSMPENAIFLKLNDISTTLSCPSSELERTEGDLNLWFLLTANSPGLGSSAIYCEDYETSRKSVKRTIFYPGGYLNCIHVHFSGSTALPEGHYMVQIVLEVEELHTKSKENYWKFSALINAPRQHLRELVLAFCQDILVHLKVKQVT